MICGIPKLWEQCHTWGSVFFSKPLAQPGVQIDILLGEYELLQKSTPGSSECYLCYSKKQACDKYFLNVTNVVWNKNVFTEI